MEHFLRHREDVEISTENPVPNCEPLSEAETPAEPTPKGKRAKHKLKWAVRGLKQKNVLEKLSANACSFGWDWFLVFNRYYAPL